MMADDSDDDFVSYGTALEPIENDEARRKPVLLEDQIVTDKQGRQRFHGAFTGGFSAGYFNSVGTKEGWTPSTFVSSREQRTGGQSRQRAEDFMDQEDLGDFGIAPRKVVTTEKFTGEGRAPKRLAGSSGPGVIPGEPPLQDLIVMSNESIGARLLRKMGWKQGQGVGPKVRRRKKKSALGASMTSDNDQGEDEDFYKDFLFAPVDAEEIALHPKDDYHGIGYRGLDPAKAGMGGHVSLFEEQPVYSRSGRRGIGGQAFGVGAFETADDDIYGMDSMSNYDRVLGGEGPKDTNYGWTAPRGHGKVSKGVLESFKASATARPPNKIFPPPVLPKDFRPFHTMEKSAKENLPPGQAATDFKSSRFTLSAPQRAAMLGEEQLPGPTSVFDFLSTEDREKLKSSSLSSQASTPAPSRGQQTQEPTPSRFHRAPSPTPAAPTASDPRHLQAPGSGFQPFASDAAKQQRYEEYLARKRSGKDSGVAPPTSDLTEWERQRESEEFVRAAALYQPLSGLMATRFVSAKHKDDEDTVDVPAEEGGDKSEQAKAADMKMFGKLTRDTLEWHPDSLLCKRFNLPNPYPGSSVVGLPTVKKDKFSVFNFLSITPASGEATVPSSSAAEPVESRQPKDKPSRWDKKPALLANVGVSKGKEGGVSSGQMQGDLQTTDEAETEKRPPMDLFKTIFADSSSSSSEEDEEEGAEEDRGIERGKGTGQEQTHPDGGQIMSSHPSGMESAEKQHPCGIQTARNGVESPQTAARKQSRAQTPPMNSDSESEGMYGPRLPPPASVAANQSTEGRGQGSADMSDHRRSKSHRKEKRRKKHSSSRHKSSKDKKKSKKNKKLKKKTKARHKGHRSSSRSGHGGQHHRAQDAEYDASGSSSSSEDST